MAEIDLKEFLPQEFGSSLENIRQKKSPYSEEVAAKKGVNWVKPEYVGEVGFTEWTDEGRLRHPRFIGLRDDKKAENVVREE